MPYDKSELEKFAIEQPKQNNAGSMRLRGGANRIGELPKWLREKLSTVSIESEDASKRDQESALRMPGRLFSRPREVKTL